MRNRVVRIIALVAVLGMLLPMVAGCGSEEELLVPEFTITERNTVELSNPAEGLHYEMLENGKLLGMFVPEDLPYYSLADGVEICIRSVNLETGEASHWSETQMTFILGDVSSPDGNLRLKAPKVSIDGMGHLMVEPMEGALHYKVVYLTTGEEEYWWDGYTVAPNTPVQVYAVGDGFAYSDSELSGTVELQMESVTFSATENPISNLTPNADGSYIMTATSNFGNTYRFRLDGTVLPVDGAWGMLEGGSIFYCMDALKGIVGMKTSENTDFSNFAWGVGYELDGNDQIENFSQLDNRMSLFGAPQGYSIIEYVPNYISLGDEYCSDMTVWSITFYFDGIETQFDGCRFHDYFNRVYYLPGTPFVADHKEYMLSMQYTHDGQVLESTVDYFDTVTLGALRDSSGNAIADPRNHYVNPGDTLDITLADGYRTTLPLVRPSLSDAANVNETRPLSFSENIGSMNVLVVPIVWSDQQDRATEENLQLIRQALGDVLDENFLVTNYAPADTATHSLTSYFQTASYGQLNVRSFVTDWYQFDASYADMRDQEWQSEYEQILQWIKERYPNLDLRQFDGDSDGILDEIIFINSGDMEGYSGYTRFGFSGSYRMVLSYGDRETAGTGTPEEPGIYHYVNIPMGDLFDDKTIGTAENLTTSILNHEFGHSLGLQDYYDQGDKGLGFLGGYDMQDSNAGDWNVYSKFAAGWLAPTVVEKEDFGTKESLSFTLRSSALSADALVIPACGYDYNGTPFDEYLMIDLFTPEGLHERDCAWYGLQDSVGVRIYHVSDLMERTENKNVNPPQTFGMWHYQNNSSSVWSEKFGMHKLEILSATGKNQFSVRDYSAQDLFAAGSSFRAEDFTEFFYKGKMDNGMAFGYTITVDSIEQVNGEYVAVVTVTRN